MRKHHSFIFAVPFAFLLFGCQPNPTTQKQDSEHITVTQTDLASEGESEESTIVAPESVSGERAPTEDEIREYGIISGIEDAGYPMFVVTVDFPKRKMKRDLMLNIESISLDVSSLNTLKGKYTTMYYTSELENDLYDLQHKDISVMGEDAIQMDGLKRVAGILAGAESETMGDLPDEVTVQEKNGNQVSFEYFITPEMVAVNGEEVTAFYAVSTREAITYLGLPAE